MSVINKSYKPSLAKNETSVFNQFKALFDLNESFVVEVGGNLSNKIVSKAGISHWCSVDPRNFQSYSGDLTSSIRGIASSLPFPDDSVDYVFSCNAFHHILDLQSTLKELARVIKPGGSVYANFGPIWSAPDGSHIENLVVANREYNFWTDSILPSWSHLVFNQSDLFKLLAYEYEEELAMEVARFVHQTQWINRLTYNDYRKLFRESKFKLLFLGGSSEIDYFYNPPNINHPLSEMLEYSRLTDTIFSRYGIEKSILSVRDIEVVLNKPLVY